MLHTSRNYVDDAGPFLKWAGGKGGLIRQYSAHFPPRERFGRYYEPFLGSAAVFFYLQPTNACLADVNEKLVELYRVVQNNVEALIEALKVHRNEKDYYYRIRAQEPTRLTSIQRAARLIFLNKTCFNGLYRENRKGQFNVPFGRYENPTICDAERLRASSRALQGVELRVADFEEVVADASPGDLIYFDPPYAPLSTTSNFTSYNKHGFGFDDQKRLAETFQQLTARGCLVMLSNSSAPVIYELYGGLGYNLIEIAARRSINSRADGRGAIKELLITNFSR